MCVFLFFFFKQKTAYEMRISDWSSDVCSSDLRGRQQGGEPPGGGPGGREGRAAERLGGGRTIGVHVRAPRAGPDGRSSSCAQARARRFPRSEEHTSELQSLMRISYAVFCLKKKQKQMTQTEKESR